MTSSASSYSQASGSASGRPRSLLGAIQRGESGQSALGPPPAPTPRPQSRTQSIKGDVTPAPVQKSGSIKSKKGGESRAASVASEPVAPIKGATPDEGDQPRGAAAAYFDGNNSFATSVSQNARTESIAPEGVGYAEIPPLSTRSERPHRERRKETETKVVKIESSFGLKKDKNFRGSTKVTNEVVITKEKEKRRKKSTNPHRHSHSHSQGSTRDGGDGISVTSRSRGGGSVASRNLLEELPEVRPGEAHSTTSRSRA